MGLQPRGAAAVLETISQSFGPALIDVVYPLHYEGTVLLKRVVYGFEDGGSNGSKRLFITHGTGSTSEGIGSGRCRVQELNQRKANEAAIHEDIS